MLFQGLKMVLPVWLGWNTDEAGADTPSLLRYTTTRGVQRWRWRFDLEPLPRGVSLAAVSVHRAQQGIHGRFDFDVPQLVDGAEVGGGVTVAGAAGAEFVTLTIPAGARVLIPKGVFVSFGSGRKIYQTTAAVDLPATGSRLGIFPKLVATASGGLDVTPTARAMYARDGREGLLMTRRGLSRITVELVEALR